MGLDSIVNVSIVRGTKSISKAGFGTPLIMGPNGSFSGVRTYVSLAGVAADFLTSQEEYLAAAALFAQSPKPKQIKIKKTSTVVAQVTTLTPTVVNNAVYTVTIDGVTYSYTADATATAAEIVTGLTALVDADSNCPADASGTTTLVLTAKSAGVGFTVEASVNLAIVLTTANVGIASDILNAVQEDNDWYCLITTSITDATIFEAAKTIEGLKKIYIVRQADSDIRTAVTTDIASKLKNKNYFRTALFYSNVVNDYADAAFAGALLTYDPGSETWVFKTLAGVTVDDWTDSEENYLKNKNVNYYVRVAGVAITLVGKTCGGEYIDVIRFADWLQARMQERVYSRLVNTAKIPYTDGGVAIIETDVRAQLEEGIRVGGLSPDPAYEVTVPKVADVSQVDRAARLLPGVSFVANLAGAIHAVEISGVVQV